MFLVLSKYLDDIIYGALFILAITVNKYVLSVIHFTIPTVFQGWQTLVCVIILSVLTRYDKYGSEFKPLEKLTLYRLLPKCLMFVGAIVSGSKALAELPVPTFVSSTNIIPAILTLVDSNGSEEGISFKVCGSMAICGTFLLVLLADSLVWKSSCFWLIIHIVLLLGQTFYSRFVNLAISDITCIYYCNFISIIILLPLSIYLQEAADAYRFNHWRDGDFYLGCMLSGIFGVFLQLWTVKIQNNSNFLNVQGIAKLVTVLIAWRIFFANIEPIAWCLILFNLFVGAFVLNFNEIQESANKGIESNIVKRRLNVVVV